MGVAPVLDRCAICGKPAKPGLEVRDWSVELVKRPYDLRPCAVRKLDKRIAAKPILDKELGATLTLGQVLDALHADEIVKSVQDQHLNEAVTLGQAVDFLINNEALKAERDREFTFKTTIGEVFDLVGEENVKNIVQEKTAAAGRKPEYDRTVENVVRNWTMLFVFVIVFAALATISLEFIDKDRR